ncbi:MAG TPA: MFS transporter [Reyranella sp.]|nr:MFS transporter [Reyranella sp.]
MAPADLDGSHGRRVVWAAFVIAVFGWGVGFYGPGVYLAALNRSHGWPIATISLAITAHFLVSAVLITVVPDAYRRFGAASITVVGAVCTAAGAVAWTNAQEIWQIVPALLLSGVGWSAMSGAALNLIVAPWFERDRPKAISTAFNGASIGGLLFAPLWTALIAHAGLAAAGLLVALATVGVICPVAWAVLRRSPPGTASKAPPPTPRRALFGQPRFLTVSVAFALGLFVQIGLFAHLIARLEPAFGATIAALAISLATLCAVLGRTLMGWLLGDHDRRLAAAANLLMQATGTLLLAFSDRMAPLALGCVLFGLGAGNLTSLPPLIAQREFRPADAGTVVALVTAINQAVFAFAPAIFGGLREVTGAYIQVFVAGAVLQGAAAGIVVLGRRFS